MNKFFLPLLLSLTACNNSGTGNGADTTEYENVEVEWLQNSVQEDESQPLLRMMARNKTTGQVEDVTFSADISIASKEVEGYEVAAIEFQDGEPQLVGLNRGFAQVSVVLGSFVQQRAVAVSVPHHSRTREFIMLGDEVRPFQHWVSNDKEHVETDCTALVCAVNSHTEEYQCSMHALTYDDWVGLFAHNAGDIEVRRCVVRRNNARIEIFYGSEDYL